MLKGRTEPPLDRYLEMVGLLRTLSTSEGRRDDTAAVCVNVRSLPQSLVRQDGWHRKLRFSGYGDYQRLKGEMAKILTEVTGLFTRALGEGDIKLERKKEGVRCDE